MALLATLRPVPYLDERFDVFARLRKDAAGRSLVESLRLDGRCLRFSLGTSLADLRVPVHVAPQLEEALRAAVRDLFFLLSIRHRAAIKEHEYDRLLLLDGFDPRSARAVSFSAPSTVARDGIRRAFLEAPELHPALDSGILASWISSGRPGRVLVGALNALFRRAAEEGTQSVEREPTPYLLSLALRKSAGRVQEAVKDLPLGGPIGRALTGAVATGILVALRLALRESSVLTTELSTPCEAAANAVTWFSGLRHFWGSGAQVYGPAFVEAPSRFEASVQKVLAGAAPELIAREAAAEVQASKELQKKAAKMVAAAKLRSDLLALLRMIESGRAPTLGVEGMTLSQLYQFPGALERVLSTSAARKDLVARAKSAAKGATNEAARALLEEITSQAKEWRDDDAGDAVEPSVVLRTWATAVAALVADAAVDRALDQADLQLVQRTGAESEGGITDEYESGKVYLFGLDVERPILMTRARAQQMGHLFCDMKDFTKRTAFLKEAVVSDFLAREFYGPILTAAARYAHGAAHLADKGGIYLNNLLGDAVSFSGDIVSLVELSRDIRVALASYARRLDTEASSEQVARTVAAVEEKFRARTLGLQKAVRSAQDALARGTLDPLSGEEPSHRIEVLRVEQQKLDEEREAEIALASGEKLEAGIFLSFGAAPEVATFEDHVFGHIKVSIAEKINESARGTARNGSVGARIDRLVHQARADSKRNDIVCPFAVSVSQPLNIHIQGETEASLRAALAQGDFAAAESALATPVREFVGRVAAQAHLADRGDIYNGGAALSDEALQAYVEARRTEVVFLRREVPVEQLHAVIRDRFVFPSPVVRLVLAVVPASESLHELYAFAGRALFKGFEKQGGLGVYEMIGRENPFFALLAQHHVAEWVREHEAGLTPSTGEWQSVESLENEGAA